MVPVLVPSLAERSEDIPIIAKHFLRFFHETHGHPLRDLADDAAGLLQTMAWPGNIRQLANVMERILILSNGTGPIATDQIPNENMNLKIRSRHISPSLRATITRSARGFEREYLMTQIKRFSGNISKTATS